MHKAVAESIAGLLDAIPYQVELWDAPVIDHLIQNPILRSQFDEAGQDLKWNIYRTIKYSCFS
ncbi:ATPase AAA [Novimethylophilus kurashikiensis]|uniref:ATPase AAA n=1 Tax=Novimethylophilus kurashikiensis TaxID=1825523 RepID=A0A2R5F6Z3_9PROT|nr:hypothetical protein [Novimethylophilus kurashikiensis]GBG12683.1 ATPase AAA [Novimethylophilus kurashikiensis]